MKIKIVKGFTLVELLIVIAILGLLVGIVFAIGSSIIYKSQVKQTQGTILTLMSACNQYKNIYYYYPDLENPIKTGTKEGAFKTDTCNYLEKTITFINNSETYRQYNAKLLEILEKCIYIKDEVRYGPFIEEGSLPKNPDNTLYWDAWGNYLRICPGRDHTGYPKVNFYNSTNRYIYPLDIYSIGYDCEDEVIKNATTTSTNIDFRNKEIDDIASWALSIK